MEQISNNWTPALSESILYIGSHPTISMEPVSLLILLLLTTHILSSGNLERSMRTSLMVGHISRQCCCKCSGLIMNPWLSSQKIIIYHLRVEQSKASTISKGYWNQHKRNRVLLFHLVRVTNQVRIRFYRANLVKTLHRRPKPSFVADSKKQWNYEGLERLSTY